MQEKSTPGRLISDLESNADHFMRTGERQNIKIEIVIENRK
jgi:hypothetical protein